MGNGKGRDVKAFIMGKWKFPKTRLPGGREQAAETRPGEPKERSIESEMRIDGHGDLEPVFPDQAILHPPDETSSSQTSSSASTSFSTSSSISDSEITSGGESARISEACKALVISPLRNAAS